MKSIEQGNEKKAGHAFRLYTTYIGKYWSNRFEK